MKIFLPIKLRQTGGTSTFAKNLKKGIESKGHTITFVYEPDYDILLAAPRAPWKYLWDAKQAKKPIIQRLDGVYYPTTAVGWAYPLHNAPLALIRHLAANYTIYQSRYSQRCCNRFLGKKRNERCSIIYNGVDTEHFSPEGPAKNLKDNPQQHVFITASRFRRKDQILPLIEAFEVYTRTYTTNAKFVVIGDFTAEVAHIPQQHHKNITFTGPTNNEELPDYLRSADVFLMSHLNPPCPNNVLEAMACELPICGIADGAMPELVTSGENGELLPTQGAAFYTPRHIDPHAFARSMHKIMQRQTEYTQTARQSITELFSLQIMLNNYSAIFKKAAN